MELKSYQKYGREVGWYYIESAKKDKIPVPQRKTLYFQNLLKLIGLYIPPQG